MSYFPHHSNQKLIQSPLLRSILNYALLVLLSFSFFTQHVFAFTHNESDLHSSNAGFHFSALDHHSNIFLGEEFSPQELFTAVEMELEEDDDFSNASAEIHGHLTCWNLSNELLYQSLIKTRYLQLVSNFEQQPSYPLFILYHSWKYSIS